MEVEVKLFGPVREDIGEKTLRRTLPEKATVDDLVDDLVGAFPRLDGRFVDDEGELNSSVNITVAGTNVRQLDGLSTVLDDGDVVRVAPPVVGGRA